MGNVYMKRLQNLKQRKLEQTEEKIRKEGLLDQDIQGGHP